MEMESVHVSMFLNLSFYYRKLDLVLESWMLLLVTPFIPYKKTVTLQSSEKASPNQEDKN